MANTPDMANCINGDLLSLSPYSALSYHFGMLLGVDDFETEQAYHRAKHRLHNAWLHREGVVWGFGVSINEDHGEVRVAPGLALDAAGRELHLEAEACLNVGKWFEKNQNDPNLQVEATDAETKILKTHVVIRFKACLTRQVPALMEPCNNAGTGTAYSRVFETIEILMLPGPAPVKQPPYHLLRLLFGLEDAKADEDGNVMPDDKDVLDALAAIHALPEADRPAALMTAFHRFAALDEIDLKPAKSEDDARMLLFPGRDDEAVVLAELSDLVLKKDNGDWVLTGGAVDNSVRPSHVATTTIQDLLCGPLFAAAAAAEADTGPRIDHDSIIFLTDKSIQFNVDKELQEASVQTVAFSVSTFDAVQGWQVIKVDSASYSGVETKTIDLSLETALSGLVRLIVFGTGPTPLLGADMAPLAGALGGPKGTPHNGNDFVDMRNFQLTEMESLVSSSKKGKRGKK